MRLVWPFLPLLALVLPDTGAWAETKRIFPLPPIQWDNRVSRERPAQTHGPSDIANLTGGIVFGMSPAEVNRMLATPTAGLDRQGLPFANEYQEEVRYFWSRLEAVPALREGLTGCVGANSHAVFLFRNSGLFRISWRLLPDADCPSPVAAAEGLFARYLAIDAAASVATHYHTGKADVVEITDPQADLLLPVRWDNRVRR